MKIAIRSDCADEVRSFRYGDTVRAGNNDDNCVVIGVWRDWLYLNPIDYDDAAPFTGPARDYELVTRGFW
jgi:hypothetical protein